MRSLPISKRERSGGWLSFELRLLGALLLSLGLVAAILFPLVGREFQEQLLKAEVADAKALAAHLESIAAGAKSPPQRRRALTAALESGGSSQGTTRLKLVDARSVVVAAAQPQLVGTRVSGDKLSKAFTQGAYAEREQDDHETDEAIEEEEVEGGAIEIVAPVSIAGRRYALELDKTDQVLSALLAEFRSQKLAEFAALLLLVPVLLYLLGGRGLAKRHRGAVRAAGTDPLTALGHHRALQEHLSEAVSRARRHDSPLSLALFDVDEFKLVNDRLGHRYGDNVLIEVAGLLAGGRHSDTGFRIGGDEFALVLEGSDLAEARAACERILSAFTERLPEVGLSAGLSELATHDDAESLWEQSDRALYEAKRAGRRRVFALG